VLCSCSYSTTGRQGNLTSTRVVAGILVTRGVGRGGLEHSGDVPEEPEGDQDERDDQRNMNQAAGRHAHDQSEPPYDEEGDPEDQQERHGSDLLGAAQRNELILEQSHDDNDNQNDSENCQYAHCTLLS
jgi:hypothetical protein